MASMTVYVVPKWTIGGSAGDAPSKYTYVAYPGTFRMGLFSPSSRYKAYPYLTTTVFENTSFVAFDYPVDITSAGTVALVTVMYKNICHFAYPNYTKTVLGYSVTTTTAYQLSNHEVSSESDAKGTVESVSDVSGDRVGDARDYYVNGSGTVTYTATAKPGFAFSRWDADGGTESGNKLVVDAFGSKVTAVARFVANPSAYETNYNKNNASASGNESFSAKGANFVDANSYFSLRGWRVTSWNSSAAGTGTSYAFGSQIPQTGMTVYAKWGLTSYQPVIAGGGGSAGSSPTYTISSSAQTKTIVLPTRPGYRITGWSFSGHSGSTPSISGTTLTIPANTIGNFSATPTWSANTVSVGYDNVFSLADWLYTSSNFLYHGTGSSYITCSPLTHEIRLHYASGDSASSSDTIVFTRYTGSGIYKFPIAPGTYTVSYRMRETAQSFGVVIVIFDANGNSVKTYEQNHTKGATETVQVSDSFTAPAGAASATIRFHNRTPDSNATFGYFKISPSSQHLIQNAEAFTYVYQENKTYGQLSSSQQTFLDSPSRTGHTFGGWYTATGGAGTRVTSASTASPVSIPIYAKWTANTYQVTVNPNGGTGGSCPSYTFSYSSQTKTITLPTRTGHSISSWTVSGASGGSPSASGSTLTIPANTYGNLTLKANWTANSYVVTFNSNGGGSPSVASKSVTYGGTYGTLATATRTGYSFLGWYTAASGGSKVEASTTVSITGNQTLYAHWSANSYQVSYVLDGGGHGPLHPSSAAFDSVFAISAPARANYSFLGWKVTSGLNASTAKWGTTSNPSTAVSASTLIVNGTSDVYVKNLTAASSGKVVLTATWKRKTRAVSIGNGHGSHIADKNFGAVNSVSGNGTTYNEDPATGEIFFTANVGDTYRATTKCKAASVNANSQAVFRGIVSGATTMPFTRVPDVDGKPTFSTDVAIPDSTSGYPLWTRYAVVSASADPSTAPARTIAWAPYDSAHPTETRISLYANKMASHDFKRWVDAASPSSVLSTANPYVFPVGDSNVSVKAVYEIKHFTATASVDAATLAVAPSLATKVKVSAGGSVLSGAGQTATIAYGGSATFGIAASDIPSGHGFGGWYNSSGVRVSEKLVHTVSGVAADFGLRVKLTAPVTISYRVTSEETPGTVSAHLTFNGAVHEGMSYSEHVELGGKCVIGVSPDNDSSVFVNWFDTGSQSEPLPYARVQEITVADATSVVAHFSDKRQVYYLAVYNRNVNTQQIVVSLGANAVAGNSIAEISKAEYAAATSTTALGDGKFYSVNGQQSVRISTEKAGALDFLRMSQRALGSSSEEIFSRDKTASRFVNRNLVVFVEWGDAEKYAIRAEMSADDYPDRGSVDVEGEYSGGSEDGGTYVQRDFEIGAQFFVVASPKNGWRFSGWYHDAARTQLASDDARYGGNVSGNATFYAKFERDSIALYKWEGSAAGKEMVWKSKVYELSKPANLTSVRVDSTGYVANGEKTMRFRSESFSSPNSSATSVVDFSTEQTRISGQSMRRLPSRRPERFFQVEVRNTFEVDSIVIGTSGEGLAQ